MVVQDYLYRLSSHVHRSKTYHGFVTEVSSPIEVSMLCPSFKD